MWTYKTEGQYYGMHQAYNLMNVCVPILAIHAKDDEIVNDLAAPYEGSKHNDYVVMVITASGGHLSWSQYNSGSCFTKAASAWLRQITAVVTFVKN